MRNRDTEVEIDYESLLNLCYKRLEYFLEEVEKNGIQSETSKCILTVLHTFNICRFKEIRNYEREENIKAKIVNNLLPFTLDCWDHELNRKCVLILQTFARQDTPCESYI